MSLTLRNAVATAVAYADVFNFVLTEDEIEKWLPYIRRRIRKLPSKGLVKSQDGNSVYFHLTGRSGLTAQRHIRSKFAEQKWQRARRIAAILWTVPTVRLIGVSGALSMNNTDRSDDIDFMVITAGRSMWVSRLLLVILLECIGVRRRPGEDRVDDKICLNMFLSEKALAIPVGERDFYTAHEVLQMVPIRAHKTTYKTFLTQNSWTKHYLPNAWDFNNRILRQFTDNRKLPVWRHVCSFMLALADPAAKAIQEFYMRKRRTSEIVTATMLRFHPRDARVWIKQKLQKRLDKFGIPLDKIFYAR